MCPQLLDDLFTDKPGSTNHNDLHTHGLLKFVDLWFLFVCPSLPDPSNDNYTRLRSRNRDMMNRKGESRLIPWTRSREHSTGGKVHPPIGHHPASSGHSSSASRSKKTANPT